jgi:hypothetical protein
MIPQVMDGYCNYKKIPDNYRSKVEDRVTRNYNGRILHRCIDHGLTQVEERQFTPKPCDFDYKKKTIQKLKKKQNKIEPMAICHIDQVTVSTQMMLQLKPSALMTESLTLMMEPSSTQATPLNTSQKKPQTMSKPCKMLT